MLPGQKARAVARKAVQLLEASQMMLGMDLTLPAGMMVSASVSREAHNNTLVKRERNLVASFSFSSMHSSSMPTYIGPCLSTCLPHLTL